MADDERARKERARKLREEIDEREQPPAETEEEADDESLHEYVERHMHDEESD